MNDTYIVLTISIVATIVQAIFWRWVSSIGDSSKDNSKKLEAFGEQLSTLRAEIYRDYQSKTDSHKDNDRIMQSLHEIKTELNKVNDKLDKKADK